LGLTLAALRETEGLALAQVRRSFAFDVLLAFTCREAGATLVTRNTADMARIRAVFTFGYVAPYPERP
jgi:predicted nucleic acid-binding protein